MRCKGNAGMGNQAAYPPLDQVTAELVDTKTTAHYTGYKEKTLRKWASEGGPLVPTRRDGRNRYSVAVLREFVKGGH